MLLSMGGFTVSWVSCFPLHSFYLQCDPRTRPSNTNRVSPRRACMEGDIGPHEHTYLTQHDVHLMMVEHCLSCSNLLHACWGRALA